MKKLLMLLIVISLSKMGWAQNWGGGIDDEKINWGFSFQYISAELKLVKKPNWRSPFYDPELGAYVTDSLSSIVSPPTPGFGIGFLVSMNVFPNFDVRFTPTLVFTDRTIDYNYVVPGTYNPTAPTAQRKIQTTMVDWPLTLKLKSDRIMNFRAYMLGGLKYSMDLTSGKKNNDDSAAPVNKLLKSKQNFLSYEAGLGFDIYFEWFKMSPEFKLSYSLSDVIKHDSNPYSNPLEKAKLRHFTFSLFFE